MGLRTRITTLVLAIAVPAGLIATLTMPSETAWAVKKPLTGTITCNLGTTTVTFKPPLVASGKTKADVTKIATAALSGCTSSTAGAPTSGTLKTNPITTPASKGGNLCSAFVTNSGSAKFMFTIKWSNGAVTTVAKFVGASASGTGFSLSGGKATGSFATPSGASATVAANSTDLSHLVGCIGTGSPSTISQIGVTGGSVSL
jgi:hypothetical protein